MAKAKKLPSGQWRTQVFSHEEIVDGKKKTKSNSDEIKSKLMYMGVPQYQPIRYAINENGEITVADFITYVQDKDEIKSKVMEIVNDSINDEVTIEAMDDYILAVSKVMTKNEINRLKNLMKSELDENKKMKLVMQIAELKKRMCE